MTPADGIPVIRLTLEGMRATILQAMLGYESQLAGETRNAVERFCTPENLERIISREVSRVIEAAIEEEVRNFYRSGAGREVIRTIVAERLSGDH